MRVTLEVSIAGLRLTHPIMNASGVIAVDESGVEELARAGVSAVVTKSFTLEPREGNPPPIIVPVGVGYVNAVGLANPGVEGIQRLVAAARKHGLPVIVSIAPSTAVEAEKLVEEAVESGADAIEVNLSCPHARGRGLEVGLDPKLSAEIIEAAVSASKGRPVFAKMGLIDKLVDTASRLLEAGASGLTLINTIRAMVIDVYARRPILKSVYGGLSGRAIHPIAVRAVYEVYCELRPEIIGVGGVYTWQDAVELILAGAKAVQVGTALFDVGLQVIRDIVEGVRRYLSKEGFRSVSDIVGAACTR